MPIVMARCLAKGPAAFVLESRAHARSASALSVGAAGQLCQHVRLPMLGCTQRSGGSQCNSPGTR